MRADKELHARFVWGYIWIINSAMLIDFNDRELCLNDYHFYGIISGMGSKQPKYRTFFPIQKSKGRLQYPFAG